MAIVKFSGLISEIVGRSGGSVFQKTRAGTIIRPQRAKQNNNRLNLYNSMVGISVIQQGWQSLTPTEKQLWETYSIFRKRQTRKNPQLFLKGQDTYMVENSIRFQLAQANAILTPVLSSTPILTTPPSSINITQILNTGADMEITTDIPVDDTYQVVIIYLTRPLGASQISNWNKKRLMRFNTVFGSFQYIGSVYTQAYGRLLQAGEYVNYKIGLYDNNIRTFGAFTEGRLQSI